jgi:hypothetical protein
MTENLSPGSAEEPVPVALLDAAYGQGGGPSPSSRGTGPWPYLAAGGRRLEPTAERGWSVSKEER